MAPNKNLAALKALMKQKANLGGSVRQGSGTPAPDLDNIRVAEPLTEVPPADVTVGSFEEPWVPRQSARALSTENIDPPASKRKPSSNEPQPAEGRRSTKKSKSSRSTRRQSGHVPVDDEFFRKNLEEYKVDPISASASLFKHLAEVKNYEVAEFKKKMQEELKKVEDKLEFTANLLRTKGALLDQAHGDLNRATAARDEYKTQAEEAQGKVEEMRVSISSLEETKQALEEQVSDLTEQLKKLQDDLLKMKAIEEESSKTAADAKIADLEKKLKECESERAKAEGERAKAVELAMQVADDGFMNAIEQVKLVYPNLNINHEWIRSDCEVEDGKIVYEDLETEEKTIIYPEN